MAIDPTPKPSGRRRASSRRTRWTCVAAVLLCALPLACSRKPEAGKTVLHLVTWKPNRPQAWEEIFRLFHEEYPEIELAREVGPHSSTAFHDLLTQKLKNQSTDVDVFLMDVIWPPEFGAAGWALPLDDLFPEAEQKQFLEGAILANTFGGRVYGVPLFVDAGVLYYRKDLLERYGFKPPETWQDLVAQAREIVAREAKQGLTLDGYSGQFKQYEGLVCDMAEFILSNRGAILDPVSGKSALARPEAVEAVRFVRDRMIGQVAPRGVLTYQEPESLDPFLQGRVVFHRNWPYAWGIANDPARSRVAGTVGIAALPHFPGGASHSTLGGWQVGISSFSPNREAAWKFAKFLTGETAQKVLAVKGGRAPTRERLYEDPEVLKANPQFARFKDVFRTAYPRPRTPLYPAVSNILQRYFSLAISDPSVDIEAEAARTSREIDELLALARK